MIIIIMWKALVLNNPQVTKEAWIANKDDATSMESSDQGQFYAAMLWTQSLIMKTYLYLNESSVIAQINIKWCFQHNH